MSQLQIERHGALTVVRLNRPDKRNALSFDLLRALRRTARELASDRSLRGVVLCGAGPAV